MELYEIEIEGGDAFGEAYYATTIVEGDRVEAGEVPAAVHRYAKLLRDIVGGTCTYRVGAYRPTRCLAERTEHAVTVWLTS